MKTKSPLKYGLGAIAISFLPALALASGNVSSPQGCQHPAVTVAHRGVAADPTANFYLHPARLAWSLSRPMESGEHPAVLMAHRAVDPSIDPNRFILGHPAGGRAARPGNL